MKTTIRIQNFKSLEDVTLELAPTTVFLGPNGAGKSSVLKMMKFVAINLSEPLTATSRITKYKFSEDLDFGSYREIVTNNEEFRDISFDLNFIYEDSSDAFLKDFLGFQNWEINWDNYPDLNESTFYKEIKSIFSGSRANTLFFFEHIGSIDFSLKVAFSHAEENNNFKSFEILDNKTQDSFCINYNLLSQSHSAKPSAFFSASYLPLYLLNELFTNIRWSIQIDENNWKNGLELSLKLAEILNIAQVSEDEKAELFQKTLLYIVKFYCIYSVCISRFLNILMIPSIRQGLSNIKRNRKFYRADNYIKYFAMLPNQQSVRKFYNAFLEEAELRESYLADGIDIKRLGDSDEDKAIRDEYIEERKQSYLGRTGLERFRFR